MLSQWLTTLMIAPTAPLLAPASFPEQVDRVEIYAADEATEFLAYSGEEVVAVVAIRGDPSGRISIEADFDDGYAIVDIGEDVGLETTLDNTELVRRIEAIRASSPPPQEGWGACAISAASTVVAVASGNAPGAALGGIATGCNCLPLVAKKWKEKKCPHW